MKMNKYVNYFDRNNFRLYYDIKMISKRTNVNYFLILVWGIFAYFFTKFEFLYIRIKYGRTRKQIEKQFQEIWQSEIEKERNES